MFKELERRFGEQGRELGEYRQFFENVSPLLDKLDKDPALVQAILDDKIDESLVQAVVEGRVELKDAEVVTEAQKLVRSDLGKAVKTTSPQDIERLVEKKVDEVRREFEEKAELQTFEQRTTQFIESTPDFLEYAEEIDKWLDSHDVTDIEVAYYAVKGQLSEAAARNQAALDAAERAKGVALNASGGGVTSQYADDGTPLVDKLIGGSNSPNKLW
jgi:CRISPR/Cas system CSM-associated protein Csm2 small subunit